MAIQSKLVYAKTKASFENQKDSIPIGLKPLVFIEDSKEIWINGTYFSAGYPSLMVTEENSIVYVTLGESSVSFTSTGESLSIRKGTGNRIIFNSTSLSSIITESPLEWISSEKKLVHVKSLVTSGEYGPTSQIENASTFQVPFIQVDSYGHIQDIGTTNIGIRDYVEQRAPTLTGEDRSILLSGNDNLNAETGVTEKSTLSYNNTTGTLDIPGGLNVEGPTNIDGDLTVENGYIIGDLKGSVSGDATPKIHADTTPKFGGASTNLYGHVKLQDTLGGIEPPISSDNTNPESLTTERGIAASPKLVWDVKVELEQKITEAPTLGGIKIGEDTINITTPKQILEIVGTNGINVNVVDSKVQISGIEIYGYNSASVETKIEDTLIFSEDFTVDSINKLEIGWLEID